MQFLHDSYNLPPLTRSSEPPRVVVGAAPVGGVANNASPRSSYDSEEGRAAPRAGASSATPVASTTSLFSTILRPEERPGGIFGSSPPKGNKGGGDDKCSVETCNDVSKTTNESQSLFFQSWDLMTLIEERRWPELRKFVRRRDASRRISALVSSLKFIQASRRSDQDGAPEQQKEDEIDGTVLHLLCAYRPPKDIVELILRQHPHYATEVDSFHRTPLHVAIDYAASPDVISSLLVECPLLSEAKDSMGKTALIHACENATGSSRSNGVIKALVSADPYSILEEDLQERTALEHAINAGAPEKVVRALQGTAIKVARDVRRRGGLEQAKKDMREKRELKEAEGIEKPSVEKPGLESKKQELEQATTSPSTDKVPPQTSPKRAQTRSEWLMARSGMHEEIATKRSSTSWRGQTAATSA